jgi:hypothetical protein
MILHLPGARRWAPAASLAGLVLVSTLAGCGAAAGPGNDGVVSLASPAPIPGSSATPGPSLDPEEAMEAFSKCMKEHGVEVGIAVIGEGGAPGGGGTTVVPSTGGNSDPQAVSGAFDPKKMEEADKACRDLLPSGMLGDPDATIPPEQVEQMLGFAKCMREHGIDFPDPKFDGNGMSIQVSGGAIDAQAVDPLGDDFQAAQEACGSELPGGAPFIISGGSSEQNP